MCPPQARPTSNATSSATPNAATFGSRLFSTFCASSKTAPSSQPVAPDPAILPERVPTIFEPRGRGLEPHVSTTVASAISSPALLHSVNSVSTSRIIGLWLGWSAPPAGGPGPPALSGCARPESHRHAAAQPPCRASAAGIPPSQGGG